MRSAHNFDMGILLSLFRASVTVGERRVAVIRRLGEGGFGVVDLVQVSCIGNAFLEVCPCHSSLCGARHLGEHFDEPLPLEL